MDSSNGHRSSHMPESQSDFDCGSQQFTAVRCIRCPPSQSHIVKLYSYSHFCLLAWPCLRQSKEALIYSESRSGQHSTEWLYRVGTRPPLTAEEEAVAARDIQVRHLSLTALSGHAPQIACVSKDGDRWPPASLVLAGGVAIGRGAVGGGGASRQGPDR